ncbi:NADPH oxidoreductase [Giardia muris]|uniref:NADPH oxidoreductase n=1 Tax=Giardia muris TaxID=5742 RepID=A0A3S5GR48_GIAMU|nr:NADPH oxidoreductase, putative [Giardia muris]AXQ17138.1 NADPH oxidoreductase, putative [Giardia muris]AXQ17139.1 NADPH oxidoreductase, putative [Giardia muris]TNJ26984.1 NADPH oxidoreductase [Giardia muris]TNJ29713.1 NADPH oxidoreductase [Giardia muris]|eukprot:TNJ26984.1 NADPH oxidoreductase [Giardia muris]
MRIVLYYSHLAEPVSVVNAPLIEEAKKLPNVQVRWLDSLYPSFRLTPEQIAAEQKIIEGADAVFFQFPVHWFSCPAMLKSFIDSVFAYGWAYGTGEALRGKKYRVIMTTGGNSKSYSGEFTINDLAKPFITSAKYCSMEPLPFHVIYSDSPSEGRVEKYLSLFK